MNYRIAFSGNKPIFGMYEIVWNETVLDRESFDEYMFKKQIYLDAVAYQDEINAKFGDNEVIIEDGVEIQRPVVEIPEAPENMELTPENFTKEIEKRITIYSEVEKDRIEASIKERGIDDYTVNILETPSDYALYMINKKAFIRPTETDVLNYIASVEGISAAYLIEQKLIELRDFCQNEIFKGFKADVLGEGAERTYELKIFDQINYNSQIQKFTIDPTLEGVVWSSNEGPAYYTKEQFYSLIPLIDVTLNYNWNIFYVVRANLEKMTDRIAIDSINLASAWATAKAYVDGLEKSEDENFRAEEIPEVELPSEDKGDLVPEQPEDVTVPEVKYCTVNGEVRTDDLNTIFSTLKEPAKISLMTDCTVNSPLMVNTDVEIDLNGYNITGNNCTVFDVAGNLTINDTSEDGMGVVRGGTGDSYCCIIVRDGSATLNAGIYEVGADGEGLGNSTIYLAGSGKIDINGGIYSSDAPYKDLYYVVNKKNSSTGSINITGGTFVNYNPGSGDDATEGDTFIADGCEVSVDDSLESRITYTVIAKEPEDVIEEDETVTDEKVILLTINGVESEKTLAEAYAEIEAQEDPQPAMNTIVLMSNQELETKLDVKVNLTIDLNGHNITAKETAFNVYAEEFVITGNGCVSGGSGGSYCAVIVRAGHTTLESGTYTVGGDENNEGNSTIYMIGDEGSVLDIKGGSYSTEVPYAGKYFVINKNDKKKGTINITGGTFYKFDPSVNDGHDGSFVAEGYEVVTTQTDEDFWFTSIYEKAPEDKVYINNESTDENVEETPSEEVVENTEEEVLASKPKKKATRKKASK